MHAIGAPTSAKWVATELLAYLRERRGLEGVYYRFRPRAVPNGWEAYTYCLRLGSRGRLPPCLRRPLALRLYAGPQGLPRLRREYAIQKHLGRLGFPVARPYLREENACHLGGPFMLMDWIAGETLLELLWRNFLHLWDGPARMAEVQARLHRMPLRNVRPPCRPYLDRKLDEFRTVIGGDHLGGLAPGLAWLEDHRPAGSEPPSLLHLDFHPENLLIDQGRCTAVLDWGETDVGDRHADVASSLVLMETVPIDLVTSWQKLTQPIGRWLLVQSYLFAYRRLLPLDPRRLHYYQALAALRRLCNYGHWRCAGPLAMGYKPSVLGHLQPAHVHYLERYFRKQTGVTVHLNCPCVTKQGPCHLEG